ncbi:MAG: hypothetical protein AB7F31_01770 [Parachlamydiales bacterium]
MRSEINKVADAARGRRYNFLRACLVALFLLASPLAWGEGRFAYVKGGGGTLSFHPEALDPVISAGLGVRSAKGGCFGWDLSAGILHHNQAFGDQSVEQLTLLYGRGMGLLYLTPHYRCTPYLGAGIGGFMLKGTVADRFSGALINCAGGLQWRWEKGAVRLFFVELDAKLPCFRENGILLPITLELGIGF